FPAVMVLGLGMAVSVAPLTTTVMTSVPRSEAGAASGINNAVSRVAGLLAVAIFGLVLYNTFNHSLDRRLDSLALPQNERQQVDHQRPKLAAAQYAVPIAHRAIAGASLAGYRVVLSAAAGLAVGSALSARVLTDERRSK